MANSRTDQLANMAYIAVPIAIIGCMTYTTYEDVLLNNHYFLVIGGCVCAFTFFCLFIFSKLCVLRRKPNARRLPVWALFDSDLEFEDETLVFHEEPTWSNYAKNFRPICKFRPIYAVIAGTGLASMVSALAVGAFSPFAEAPRGDLLYACLTLFITAVLLEAVVFTVAANLGQYDYKPPGTNDYVPFQEIIMIPMRVFSAKVIACMSGRILYLVGWLIQELIVVYGLVWAWNMDEARVGSSEKLTNWGENARLALIFLTGVLNLVSLHVLAYFINQTIDEVRKSLLGIFEKNWERNMKAIDFLLPAEVQPETLEQLRDAVATKRQQQLTGEENNAFEYISRPLWKTKRAFLDRPARDSAPGTLPDNGSGSNGPKDKPPKTSSPVKGGKTTAKEKGSMTPRRSERIQKKSPQKVQQ